MPWDSMGEFFVAWQHEMTPDFSDLPRSVQQLEGHYRQLLKVAGPALRAIKNDPAVAQIVQMAPTILAEAERSKPFIQDLSRQMEVAADLLSANKEAFSFAAAFAHRYLDSVSSRAALGSLERAELHTLVDAAVHDLGERTEDRQEALAEALSAEPRSSATDGQHQQGRLSLLVAVLSFLVASYAAYQNQQSGDEQQIHSQRQIALFTQINEHIRQHLDQTPEVARVPHPVPWTHVCATPPGVARAPRAPRSGCDTRVSRAARSCCIALRTRRRRSAQPRGSERCGRESLAP